MPRVVGALGVVTLLGWMAPRPAPGQVPGVPVWRPVAPPGAVVEGGVAWPSDASGGGHVWSAAVGYGEGNVALRGTLARVTPDAGSTETGWAALGRVGLVASPAAPWRLGAFAGVGGVTVRSGALAATSYRVPVGADVGIVIPTPVGILDGWVAPRLDLATADPFGSRQLTARAAFATGLDVVLLNGLGVRAAYDHVFLDDPDQSTFGVGVLFRFKPGF